MNAVNSLNKYSSDYRDSLDLPDELARSSNT